MYFKTMQQKGFKKCKSSTQKIVSNMTSQKHECGKVKRYNVPSHKCPKFCDDIISFLAKVLARMTHHSNQLRECFQGILVFCYLRAYCVLF